MAMAITSMSRGYRAIKGLTRPSIRHQEHPFVRDRRIGPLVSIMWPSVEGREIEAAVIVLQRSEGVIEVERTSPASD